MKYKTQTIKTFTLNYTNRVIIQNWKSDVLQRTSLHSEALPPEKCGGRVLLEKSRQGFLADIFKQQLNWRAGGIVGPVSLVAETIFFEVLVLKSLISVNIKP